MGEILLNSMDADGTTAGFDLEMLDDVRRQVQVPLMASVAGAGTPEHFAQAAVRRAPTRSWRRSVFHYGVLTVGEVKAHMRRRVWRSAEDRRRAFRRHVWLGPSGWEGVLRPRALSRRSTRADRLSGRSPAGTTWQDRPVPTLAPSTRPSPRA